MNLFEKIFNYQLLSRLEDSGTFMVTSHERAWLKTMLGHPAAADAFSIDTLNKLQAMLTSDPEMDIAEHLIQKASSLEKQVYHPLLRPLSRSILNRNGITATYEIKGGTVYSNQKGLPYKLEYSMVKREWYLLWFHIRNRTLQSTRLGNIREVSAESVAHPDAEGIFRKCGRIIESRKSKAVIEVVPAYNLELSRILYALSSFEKDVEYDAENDVYRVTVCLIGDESEYLLSKVRFLGTRIRVIEGDYLKQRMLQASTKALERYGVTGNREEELTS
jgi:predicted DNA-binding transcriptional regulator YafY